MNGPVHSPRNQARAQLLRSARGFTLLELLVTMVVIAVLVILVFSSYGKARMAARTVTCLGRIKSAGSLLVLSAVDEGGKLRVFSDGAYGFDYRPYFIVARQMDPGLSVERDDIMHCPEAPRPASLHWNSYAVNFTSNTAMGVAWPRETSPDGKTRIGVLSLPMVNDPAGYPLLLDSCTPSGSEEFRILYSSTVGLRHGGKANAYFLDGSARSLDLNDLAKLGPNGTKALAPAHVFDCSQNPPLSVTMPAPVP